LTKHVEGGSDALLEDLVGQGLLLVWRFVEEPLEAGPRSPKNVVFLSLEVLEVDGNDLGLDLDGVEVEL
jgi:hypothetical protein